MRYDEIREPHLREVFKGVDDGSIYLWVSKDGDDTNGTGSFSAPYKTVTKAMAVATATRKIIMLMPGEYAEVAITWSDVNGVQIKGAFGGAIISLATAAATPVVTIHPSTATGTWTAAISNVEINSNYNVGVCLRIDNTHITKKLNVYLDNVNLSTKNVTDSSLVVVNGAGAGQAIRVYATGGSHPTWEGLVDFTAADVGDRLRVYDHRIIGSITMNEAVVSELTLIGCGYPADVTVHSDTRLTEINSWHESDADPNVYTTHANSFSS